MNILGKVEEALENAEKQKKQAFDKTPEEYHHFIIMLGQNERVENYFRGELPKEAQEMGAYISNGSVYVPVEKPYMAVDGKLKWFSDNHFVEDDKRYKYNIKSNLDKIVDILANTGKIPPQIPLVVTIESELYGTLEGESAIFWEGKGADATNPIENAKTSALGRAISQAGIGLIGTGVASAEEVQEAIKQQEKMKQKKKQNQGNQKQDPPQNQGQNQSKQNQRAEQWKNQDKNQYQNQDQKSERWKEMQELINGDEVKKDMLLDYLKYMDQESKSKIRSVDDLTEEDYESIKGTIENMDENNAV